MKKKINFKTALKNRDAALKKYNKLDDKLDTQRAIVIKWDNACRSSMNVYAGDEWSPAIIIHVDFSGWES